MKNKYSNYFYTPESTRIFFSCNFHPDHTQVVERPIVFIYGLVCSNHQLSFQIPYFDQLGFPVITHDFRAHFASSGREDLDSVTFKNITSDLHHLLQHLKAKNCILISHSMGVNVALEFTRRFPEMVSQIVLISGTVLGPKQIMFNSNISDMTFPTLQWLSQKIPRRLSHRHCSARAGTPANPR